MFKVGDKVIFKDTTANYFKDYVGIIFTVKLSYYNSHGINNIVLEDLEVPHLIDSTRLEVIV